MDEEKEKKPEDKEPETAEAGADEGDEPKATTLLDKADAVSKKLEEANIKTEELLKRREELAAKEMLGGRADAGEKPPEKKKLTDTEYAEALQRGEVNPLKEDGFI